MSVTALLRLHELDVLENAGTKEVLFLGWGEKLSQLCKAKVTGPSARTIRARTSQESRGMAPSHRGPTPGTRIRCCSLSPACPTLPAHWDTARPLVSAAGAPTRAPVFLVQPGLHQEGPLSLSVPSCQRTATWSASTDPAELWSYLREKSPVCNGARTFEETMGVGGDKGKLRLQEQGPGPAPQSCDVTFHSGSFAPETQIPKHDAFP